MKKYGLVVLLIIHIFVVGSCNIPKEDHKTNLGSMKLSIPQKREKKLKEKLIIKQDKTPSIHSDNSKNVSKTIPKEKVTIEELIKDKTCFCCCVRGLDIGGNTGYFVPFTTRLESDPILKELKELKIHHPTFDISGRTSLTGQENQILNGFPNNLSKYDFIVLSGISMGSCVSWLLLDSLIKRGFAEKLIIVTFSGPNPKIGLPVTLNGEALLAMASVLRKTDICTRMLKRYWKITPESIQRLEDLVQKKGKVDLSKLLGKNAGAGVQDLKPNSRAMGEILKIMQNLKDIPALAFVGNDAKNGFKKMVPTLSEDLHGFANILISRYINKSSINHIFALYKLKREGRKLDNFKSDGLIPNGPSLPIKVIEVPGYHDDHMSKDGKISETVHGIAAKAAVDFISQEIQKKVINSQ